MMVNYVFVVSMYLNEPLMIWFWAKKFLYLNVALLEIQSFLRSPKKLIEKIVNRINKNLYNVQFSAGFK